MHSRCPGRLAPALSRRTALQLAANGFGLVALQGLLAKEANAAVQQPHFTPRAKRVIFLFMDGGVSHVDSFDPKPELDKRHGQVFKDARKLVRSPWKFQQRSQSGLWVSDLFPHIASRADDICVIRSMKADLPIHSTGVLLMHTGHNLAGRPSLGSWTSYGLGSENEDLPGYLVLSFGHVPVGGLENFSSGFLPASHQATLLRADGPPLENLAPATSLEIQQAKLRFLRSQDAEFASALGGNAAIDGVVANREMACRMQLAVPDLLDETRETAATHKLYGLDAADNTQRLYARQCLRARRLVESGVRFVQVNCPYSLSNGTWDQHGNLKKGHEQNSRWTDQAIAGLIVDLKQRGLWDDTLVLWAGEFGRTPHAPGEDGRDHHPEGFSVFLAGGAVRGGLAYGNTDEIGVHAVENIVTIHDLHATILHLLGFDHERLTYRHAGRDFRLTDVSGRIVREILA
jgi:hypothetical protein